MKTNENITNQQRWYRIGQICVEENKRGKPWREVVLEQMQLHHYSRFSIQRFADYTTAVDHLEAVVPGLREEILAGKHRLSVDNVLILACWQKEEVLAALAKLADESTRICDVFPRHRPERIVRRGKTKTPSSVKDTPAHDPDAQVTGLIFTIPSWQETLERTALNTDYSTLSVEAYRRLLKALRALAACTNEFIQLMAEE